MMKGLGYIRQYMEDLAILYIRLAITNNNKVCKWVITSVVFNNSVLIHCVLNL